MFTFKDKANAMRVEFDGRHPKARMTLMAYFAEAGVVPDPDNMTSYLDMMHQLNDYVYEGADEFFTEISQLDEDEDEGEQLSLDSVQPKVDTNFDDGLGGAYL